ELAQTWLQGVEAQVAAGERSERTLEDYGYRLSLILPSLGKKRVQDITTDDCANLISQLRNKGLAPKTIAGCLVPLNRVFALALRRGQITDNPLSRLDQ